MDHAIQRRRRRGNSRKGISAIPGFPEAELPPCRKDGDIFLQQQLRQCPAPAHLPKSLRPEPGGIRGTYAKRCGGLQTVVRQNDHGFESALAKGE